MLSKLSMRDHTDSRNASWLRRARLAVPQARPFFGLKEQSMKLHGAIVSIALALTGCVRDSVDAPVLGPIETVTRGAEQDLWQPGTHYEFVQPSAEPSMPEGKVTVVEFFWYGSSQCYTLDPHLVLWNRRKPEHVEFKRVPTTWGQYDRPHARLFYTLEELGRN